MTGNKCFLDTSVIIHFFKNNPKAVDLLSSFEELFASTVVVGELYYGAYASSDHKKHIKQIDLFLGNCNIVEITTETSKVYGQIKSDLKRKGTPIPENDIWIAANAIAHKLPLFSTDNHFKLLELELIDLN